MLSDETIGVTFSDVRNRFISNQWNKSSCFAEASSWEEISPRPCAKVKIINSTKLTWLQLNVTSADYTYLERVFFFVLVNTQLNLSIIKQYFIMYLRKLDITVVCFKSDYFQVVTNRQPKVIKEQIPNYK